MPIAGTGKRRAEDIVLFIIGDYWSGTGPARVTRSLIETLPEKTLYLEARAKLLRAVELFRKMGKADVAVFSGHSRQNLFGMSIAHRKGIPCIFIMHGCVEYENEINRVPDPVMARDEREMLKRADLILAVSEQFEEWLKAHYPEHREKISHLTNGVDWNYLRESATGDRRLPGAILSVGGGMPRKRIIKLCEAIDILRKRGHKDLTLTVAGAIGADSVHINSYPFVNDLGLISEEELKKLYHTHRLFVQNSIFETFGLAPVEALLSGAEVLLSDRCGVLSILKGVEEGDLIHDPDDPEEIAGKILPLLTTGNHSRLMVEIDKESTSWETRGKELIAISASLLK